MADQINSGMRYYPVILFLIVIQVAYSQSPEYAKKKSYDCVNRINIKGETNIAEFYLHQQIPEELICGQGNYGWMKLPNEPLYEIRIPLGNFEANNKFVYRDFLSLLDASNYPFIRIFIEEKQFINFYKHQKEFLAEIRIALAGENQNYKVECVVSECLYGEKIISGQKKIKLTDFKLEPPVKSLGLIKVKNELNINFEFRLPDEKFTLN